MAERYAFTASLLEVILLGFYHHSLYLIFPAFLQVTPRRNRLHIFRLPQVAHNSKLCRCRVLVAGPDSAVLPGLQNMLPSATKAKNAQQWALFVPLWSQLSTRRRSSRSRPRLAVFRGEKHRSACHKTQKHSAGSVFVFCGPARNRTSIKSLEVSCFIH